MNETTDNEIEIEIETCTCERCGKTIGDEGDVVKLSIGYPVGYDDYDYEDMVICSECDRNRSTVYREPPVSYGHDPEDEIPF